jgi:hypothetical protein
MKRNSDEAGDPPIFGELSWRDKILYWSQKYKYRRMILKRRYRKAGTYPTRTLEENDMIHNPHGTVVEFDDSASADPGEDSFEFDALPTEQQV